MVNNRGYILHKVAHKKGKRHDYDIYKENHPVISKQVVTIFDLGYLGMEKDYPDQPSSLPNRKKRNQGWLYEEEKEYNRTHSKKREYCDREHTICRLKKFKILNDIFRNKLKKYNKVSDIV
jgi:DDE superfamily endonuclease